MGCQLALPRQPGDAPAVTGACMYSYKRTWLRILTMAFLPQEVSPKEVERLEEGDNCYKVRLSALITLKADEHGRVHRNKHAHQVILK